MTYEKGETLSISKVIQLASKRSGEFISKLYNKVRGGYNHYLQLRKKDISADKVTVCDQMNDMDVITNDTPLVRFLTGDFNCGLSNHNCNACTLLNVHAYYIVSWYMYLIAIVLSGNASYSQGICKTVGNLIITYYELVNWIMHACI